VVAAAECQLDSSFCKSDSHSSGYKATVTKDTVRVMIEIHTFHFSHCHFYRARRGCWGCGKGDQNYQARSCAKFEHCK
jgi:hypothetical protein